jgi:two-component system sensor histidine kinase UhpB
VANVLSAAVERKRLEEEREQHGKELASRIIQAQEEERKRISRELHDETAQTLSVLVATLDLLESAHAPEDPLLQQGFSRAGALARRALDETRALAYDLRPTILDDAGLAAALEWLGDEYERDYQGLVDIEVNRRDEAGLSPEITLALFRIAQEALTNSGKHSAASAVQVRLTLANGAAELTVSDNGRGFDPARVSGPTREGRLGLFGMRERATLLGGCVNIASSPGKGTCIRVEIPFAHSIPRAG